MSPVTDIDVIDVKQFLACAFMFVPGFAVPVKGADEASHPVTAGGNRPSAGTLRMTQRLKEWDATFGTRTPYENRQLISELEQRLAPPQTTGGANGANVPLRPVERFSAQLALGTEYLNVGEPEKSLGIITNLLRDASRTRVSISPKQRRDIRLLEGLAYLRLGELENCIGHHNPDSCLFPVMGGGQHVSRRGSENAFAVFSQLAQQRPGELGLRWLLNVSAMTLGRYPWEVPADHLLPNTVFRSEAPLPRFPEIAARLGLAGAGRGGLAGGVVAEDFDGDGWTDLLLTDMAPMTQCQLYRNLGNGRFENITDRAGLTGVTGGLNVIHADYNNDGWPDIYIVRGAWMGEQGLLPNSLLANNGDGTFSDRTEEAGLLAFHPALSAAWFDANNDGWLDLFVGYETLPGGPAHTCPLYINNRNGTFTDHARTAGVAVEAFVRGVTAGDFDNDGWPDLYLSCLGQTNLLFRNAGPQETNRPGHVRFSELGVAAGVTQPLLSFPTWFWDYDNDGWLDLWISGYGADARSFYDANLGHFTLGEIVAKKLSQPSKAETPRLYHNSRQGVFTDVTREAGMDRALLTMGANFGDIDTDGFLDLYAGTGTPYFGSLLPNEMFRNHEGRRFQDVTTAGGFGHLQKGHGIAFADLNGDGHQEVIANMGGAYAGDNFFDAVFANPGNSNHWVKLKLAGTRSNRSAIGARIKVVVSSSATAGPREIHRMVCSGGSFGSSPLTQEIGLGATDTLERVEVWWPTSGLTNRFSGLSVDRTYLITEGSDDAIASPGAASRFAWPK